ncbi:MAG: SDR family oxidoreductase [Clostridiaceae bacterium]|nr:SDR family oxidoreductase [Clostridiaceae bacterium]
MGNYYDVYQKDVWRNSDYNLMEKFSLKGKKGFVTGGGGGIGRNTAAAWAEAGADVAIVDLPGTEAHLETVAKELSDRYKVKVVPLYCDVSDSKQVDQLRDDLIKELGTVDIAHINAGVCLGGDDVDVPYDVWRKTIEINLDGAHLTAQLAQKIMREHNHGGSIIFTSSLSGYNANNFRGSPTPVCAYGTTKAGISQLARYMAAGLAPYNIRVNSISPGYVWSGIHEGVMDKEAHDILLEPVPLRRFGRTDELQGAILFLSSEASSYVTGINLPIDGGYSIY